MTLREVPFLAVGGVYEEDDLQAATAVLEAVASGEGSFFPLPEEAEFQKVFAAHEGAAHAVGVNSCGTALDCCMMALDLGPGDEVITTPLTFVCTAGCAVARGARVVFADIDTDTLNLDPHRARERITDRTRAIIPVHFAGLAADLDAFEELSRETGVPVIYDAAHAVGATSRGEPVGGRGRASCYSFQSNKNMTCLGEGGAITTDDADFAKRVRQLKTFGYVYGPEGTRVESIGFNYRMGKVQYAVGLTQLAKIDRVVATRRQRMLALNDLLTGVPELILPSGFGPDHACHLHVVRLDTERVDFTTVEFTGHLKETYRVHTAKHYPPVWSWDAFSRLGYDGKGCPEAARAADQVFSTPVIPGTTDDDLEYIAWALKQTISDLGRG